MARGGAGFGRNIGGIDDFTTAIREVVEDLKSFDGALKIAGQGVKGMASQTVGFAANATVKRAKRFARDVAFRALDRQATYGGNFYNNFMAGTMEAMSKVPILGSAFAHEVQPIQKAAQRTLGITGAVARAGGEISPDMREALNKEFLAQEQRAYKEFQDVGRMEGTQLKDVLVKALEELTGAVEDNTRAMQPGQKGLKFGG